MIYSRSELLKLWLEVISYGSLEGTPLAEMKTRDYREGNLYCSHCKTYTARLSNVKGRWACDRCNDTGIGPKYKPAFVYRITNDMIDYFGEVKSEYLFDSAQLQGFVNFVQLNKKSNEFLHFLAFIRKLLMKEVGSLGVLDFLTSAQRSIDRQNDAVTPSPTE